MRPAPRCVFFDAGGTLLEAAPSVGEVYAGVLARFGRVLEPLALDRGFRAAWVAAGERLPVGSDRFGAEPGGSRRFWRALLDQVVRAAGDPRPLDERELEAVLGEFAQPTSYRVFPEGPEVLDALGRRGIRMGIISNWDGRLPALLDALGIGRYFSACLVSAIEGLEKPAPAIFARACRRLGVRPEEALHVGDSERDDFDGARAASLQAVLLDRSASRHGDHVIHDLTGLLERVAGFTHGGPT